MEVRRISPVADAPAPRLDYRLSLGVGANGSRRGRCRGNAHGEVAGRANGTRLGLIEEEQRVVCGSAKRVSECGREAAVGGTLNGLFCARGPRKWFVRAAGAGGIARMSNEGSIPGVFDTTTKINRCTMTKKNRRWEYDEKNQRKLTGRIFTKSFIRTTTFT